ncbi:TRAP transporter substrate-binding protein DctP [Bacillus sp. V3B]|uniref:TRAP transporter substrate-binding protein n=1 Tax=Bacillus sp. V3B TaxID=2804915 RepID=UPI00210A0DC9|nr:TRAP transporter substrate-binding protein DctP [Bacillus sp. V3B]MCQ6275378.1 TRAP transporter substrate-binding protein DctP [Bacillus sp. V3B]
MKIKSLFLSLVLILGIALSACSSNEASSGSSEEKIVIKMADHFPTGHFLLDMTQTFMDRAVELSGGKIKFEYYSGGQLGTINESAGLVKDGAVDIAYALIPSAGFLPLSSVSTLPNKLTSASDNGKVLDQLIKGPLKEELEKNGLVPILSFVNPPNSVLSAKKVSAVEDIAGLKLRGSGGVLNLIPGVFNASSVSIGVNDLYESMQRGVADASLMTIASAPSYHLNEVTNHVLTNTNFGMTTQLYAMNLDKWNSLPEDVQEALAKAGKEATESLGTIMLEKEKEAIELFKNEGIEVTQISPEKHKEIVDKLLSLDQHWLKSMEDKGIDGKKVLEEYRAITEKIYEENQNK